MALVIKDRVKETTTTTGTGTYTLAGAVSGFETFTANLSNSDTTYYVCTDNTDFEVGLGTFTSSGTTLARTTILASSNSNNEVNWSSGTRTIFMTYPADKAVFEDADGHVSIPHDLFIAGGLIDLKNDGGAVSKIKFYCESSNAHAQTLQGAAHSEAASNTLTLPSTGDLISTTSTSTLTNKSLTAPTLTGSSSAAGSILFKEDTDNGTNAVTLIGPASTADVTVTLPAATDTLVGKATTDTLTNKSIDSDNNTITNIVNADIKSSAAIADTKLDTISTAGKVAISALDIDGGTDIGAALADADEIIVDDGGGGTNRRADMSRVKTYIADVTLTTAAQTNITSLGTLTALTVDNVAINGTTIGHTDDTDLITLADGAVTVAGDVTLSSTDSGATDAPTLTLKRDSSSPANFDDLGQILFLGENNASEEIKYGQIFVQASTVADGSEESRMIFSIMNDGAETQMMYLDAHQGGGVLYLRNGIDILFEGASLNGNETTLTVADPTADRTVTLPDATGTVITTGNTSDITTVGTLTTLTVDNVIINGSTIGHTGDTDLMTVASGVLTVAGEVDATSLDISGDADIDGTLEADAITVNGTALNTVIAGVTVANATTAAVATTVTISDNESTNEENAVVFTSGGDVDGGNIGLESDGDLTYNPSTGTISATIFKGNIDAVDGDFDGTLEADAITLNGTAITTVATLSTGISNGNVLVANASVADNDFLRVDGTSIEGRSASEVVSDLGVTTAAAAADEATALAIALG